MTQGGRSTQTVTYYPLTNNNSKAHESSSLIPPQLLSSVFLIFRCKALSLTGKIGRKVRYKGFRLIFRKWQKSFFSHKT